MTRNKNAVPKAVITAWIWIICLILLGGTFQARDIHNVFLEVTASGFLGFYAWRRPDIFRPSGMMVFGYVFVGLIALHLIPIPFSIWSALPGHKMYAEALHVANMQDHARPLSITPDLTLSCLTGALPVLATIAMLRSLDTGARRKLVIPFAFMIAIGAIMGMLQMAQGSESLLRLYRFSTPDGPIGFFSNRNHHALSLAIGIPMCIVAFRYFPKGNALNLSPWLALGIALLLSLSILVAGSRGALLAALIGLPFLCVPLRSILTEAPKARRPWIIGSVIACLIGAAAGMVIILTHSDRALSLTRLWKTTGNELRSRTYGPIFDAAREYLPLGSGFGTFDTVFRSVEPMNLLKLTFLNQAHNEPLQILLEAGLPGVILLLIVAGAILRSFMRGRTARGDAQIFRFLGITILIQCVLVSLADYPLRSPLLASISLLACAWVIDAARTVSRQAQTSMVASRGTIT